MRIKNLYLLSSLNFFLLLSCSRTEYVKPANPSFPGVDNGTSNNEVLEDPNHQAAENNKLFNSGILSYDSIPQGTPLKDILADEDFDRTALVTATPTPWHKVVDWGAFVSVYAAVPANSSATLSVFREFGSEQTVPLLTLPVDPKTAALTPLTITTDKLEPGLFRVELLVKDNGLEKTYLLFLTIRPKVEISLKNPGETISVNTDFEAIVYLPQGTHGTTVSFNGSSKYEWQQKSIGPYLVTLSSSTKGIFPLTATVQVNGVSGTPATLSVTIEEDCGTPYECSLKSIKAACSDPSKYQVYSQNIEVPKVNHCSYGTGENLAKVASNTSYVFLIAEKNSSASLNLPPNSIICGLKSFESKNKIIHRDQMAITLNDVIIASTVAGFASNPSLKENGFSLFDWPTIRGTNGYNIGGVQVPPIYCLGYESVEGQCSLPERAQSNTTDSTVTSKAKKLSLSPLDPAIQKLFAHFATKANNSIFYDLSFHAFGDADDDDCLISDEDQNLQFFEIKTEWKYVSK